jgi:hypothetical protein
MFRPQSPSFRLFSNFDSIRVAVNIAEVVVLILGPCPQDIERRSVFPLSPIAVLWINMVRRRFLDISLEPNPNNFVSTHSS